MTTRAHMHRWMDTVGTMHLGDCMSDARPYNAVAFRMGTAFATYYWCIVQLVDYCDHSCSVICVLTGATVYMHTHGPGVCSL